MSIATEITRLQNAKAAIKTAIEGKGVPVPDATLMDGMAALIDAIEAGGGGSVEPFSEVLTGTVTFASESTTWTLPKADNLLGVYMIRIDQWGVSGDLTNYIIQSLIFGTPQKFGYFSASSWGKKNSCAIGAENDSAESRTNFVSLSSGALSISYSGKVLNYLQGTYWYALIFGSKG